MTPRADQPMLDLLLALRTPSALADLGPGRITDLISRARTADVLGRLGGRALRSDGAPWLTDRLRGVFVAAVTAAQAFQRMARFEADRLMRLLAPIGHDIVLLKGSAYVVAELPPAAGRRLSDVDILVPRAALERVEGMLLQAGWEQDKTDDYDQRYFREWMHELPPLRHRERHTVVDLHHTILPLTGRLRPDPAALIASSVPIRGWPGLRVLAPHDMVLHNIVHHFQDGEFKHTLRELIDLDDLLRHFGTADSFWDDFLSRTEQFGFGRPAFYALRYARRLLGTAVPERVTEALCRHAPPGAMLPVMDYAMPTCLRASGRLIHTVGERAAARLLYARAQWLKMPPTLLAQHSVNKALRRLRPGTAS